MQRRVLKSAAVVLALTTWAHAEIIYVDRTATGNGGGTSWADAFTDLQSALAAANAGDQIWVAAGAYRPDEGPTQTAGNRRATFHLPDGIDIYGGFPPGGLGGTEAQQFAARNSNPLANGTVLSGDLRQDDNPASFPDGVSFADNSYHVLCVGCDATGLGCDAAAGSPAPILDGFTIYGGNANGPDLLRADVGAGMLACEGSPRLLNTIFTANYSLSAGGAVYYAGSGSLSLTDSTLDGNETSGFGGAVAVTAGSADIDTCIFASNEALGVGGALYLAVTDAQIDNATIGNNAASEGAGVFLQAGSLLITSSKIAENQSSGRGAGISCTGSSSLLAVNSRLLRNIAAGEGGGVFENSTGKIEVVNSLIVANSATNGGGLRLDTNSLITNCTVYENLANGTAGPPIADGLGGGVYASVTGQTIKNSIFWANRRKTSSGVVLNQLSGTTSPTYSCVQGGAAGTGNIASNPAFNDPNGSDKIFGTDDDDFSLQDGSACADAGDNAALDVDGGNRCLTIDLANNYRVADDPARADAGNNVDPCSPPPGGGAPVVDMGPIESASFAAPSVVVFVDADATGANTGANWANAFTSLQDALSFANDPLGRVSDIWVARGTYRPYEGGPPITDTHRWATFRLKSDVAIYGGFDGTEVLVSNPTAFELDATRNLRRVGCDSASVNAGAACLIDTDCDGGTCQTQNLTILSGDLAGNDTANFGNRGDNSYHVVDGTGVKSTAILDGFVITAGDTNYNQSPCGNDCADSYGGGLFIDGGGSQNSGLTGGSPVVRACVFSDNRAIGRGGAVNNAGDAPVFSSCLFVGNRSNARGGGAIRDGGPGKTLWLDDCVFRNNVAFGTGDSPDGGAISSVQKSLKLTRCRFESNSASSDGGALYINGVGGKLDANDCLFVGNDALNRGGAISGANASTLSARDCTFVTNSAVGLGGSIYMFGGSIGVADTVFERNTSGDHAGAIVLRGSANLNAVNCAFLGNVAPNAGALHGNFTESMTIANCAFVGNRSTIDGGAIGSDGALGIYDSTLIGNETPGEGGGVVFVVDTGCGGCERVIVNSIFDDNSAGVGNQIHVRGGSTSAISVTYSFVDGGWPGVGNLPSAPQPVYIAIPNAGVDALWGTADDDYGILTLAAGSVGIDAGNNAGVPADALDLNSDGNTTESVPFDLAGLPRIAAGVVDMGAYESRPDCQSDGAGNGIPDDCDIDCGASLDCGPGCGLADDCNENGIPDECELGGAGMATAGTALHFDGVNDLARVTLPFGLPVGSEPRTMEAWLMVDGSTGKYQPIISYGTPLVNNQFFSLEWGGGVHERQLGLVGWNNDLWGSTLLDYGTLYHVAVSFDGNTARLFVDGSEYVSGAFAWNTVLNSDGLRVGSASENDGFHEDFFGQIDEVRVWNYVRSAEQILGSMSVSLTGSEPGLVAYYRFDEGSGQVMTDSSDRRNNGYLGLDGASGADDPQWASSAVAITATVEADCDGNSILDECELANGSPDEDYNYILDLCVGDCNNNIILDYLESDGDGDGVIDECDNCPQIFNPTQINSDNASGDPNGDACDICPGFDDSADADGDGVPDGCDNCPDVYNPANAVRVDCNLDGDTLDLTKGEGVGDQCDRDEDGVGDACDNCIDFKNPDQLDQDDSGFGDACESAFGLGAILRAPNSLLTQIDYARSFAEIPTNPNQRDPSETDPETITSWTTSHSAAFYHPAGNSYGPLSEPADAWFAVEAGIIRMRWRDGNNTSLGQSLFVIPDIVAQNDWTNGVRYFLDYNEDAGDRANAGVMLTSPYDATIRYNSTILGRSERQIPGTGTSEQNPAQYYQFADFHIDRGLVIAEDYCPEGKVVIEYNDGPNGAFVGFEVVDLVRMGTPAPQAVPVGRRLRLPEGADDCRAVLVSNTQRAGVPSAWQRSVADIERADIYPIRPEPLPSNFVVAWYQSSVLPNGVDLNNCWTHSIMRYTADWPSDPQAHVLAAGGQLPAEGSLISLRVGANDRYCSAEVMHQAPFAPTDPEPDSEIVNGVLSVTNPGFTVLRLDSKPLGGLCGEEVSFEVIASHDHRDQDNYVCAAGRKDLTSCTTNAECNSLVNPPVSDGVCAPDVFKGSFDWAIGQQITDGDHDPDTLSYPHGFLKEGQPHAPGVYAETGQIFPVNTSADHGLMEVWWYQEGRDCTCDQEAPDVCMAGDVGMSCAVDDDCDLSLGNGVCNGATCMAGTVGQPCSVDADCDTMVQGRCGTGVCADSGNSDGALCQVDDDCGCTGNFAPGIYWPHKVAEYNAVWPPNSSCACMGNVCSGSGVRDGDSCTLDTDCGCEQLGEIVIASRLGGRYPEDGVLEPKDYSEYAELYGVGNFITRSEDQTSVPGWNPNDEHAIILPISGGQRPFAVRDDDPWQVGSGHPYTLVEYPASGNPSAPDLYDLDVYLVKAEETGVGTCDMNMCDGGLNDGETCSADPDCDFLLDYDFFVAQNDPTTKINVQAGQPINPLFPINFASPLCDDQGAPPLPLTFVEGDALWQDRKGGVWAAEAYHDGLLFEYGICQADKCIGGLDHNQACMSDVDCRRSKYPDGTCVNNTICAGGKNHGNACSVDADCMPQSEGTSSASDIYLWENWSPDYGCQPWREFAVRCAGNVCVGGASEGTTCSCDEECVAAGAIGWADDGTLCTSDGVCDASGCRYSYPIRYNPSWPPVPPACLYPDDPNCARPLLVGQSVDQSGQCGQIQVLHDSVGLRVIDPTLWVGVDYPDFPNDVNLDALPPHLINGEIGGGGEVPDRVRYDIDGRKKFEFRGIMSRRDRFELLRAGLHTELDCYVDPTNPDEQLRAGADQYCQKVHSLYDDSRDQLTNPLTDSGSKFVTVGDKGAKPGWITLAFQNDQNCIDQGLPVSVEVWNVACPPFESFIRVIQPECVFSEKLTMQFAGDLGGDPDGLVFQWQYSVDYDPANPGFATWNNYNTPQDFMDGLGLREVLIEGASEFTLADSWWRVRYRGYDGCPCPSAGTCTQGCDTGRCNPNVCIGGLFDGDDCVSDTDCGTGRCGFICDGGPNDGNACSDDLDCGACDGGADNGLACALDSDCGEVCCPAIEDSPDGWPGWLDPMAASNAINTQPSDWTAPQLAEGWVKRVVRGLNPFDQRIERFHENPVATYVDMIGQAGKRFEQEVALNCTPDNINTIGLIEAYETVLKRARKFSIDVGTSYAPANKAIQLVAGKIVDLYMLLGNEAFADAMDPTVGLFVGQGEEPLGYDPHAVFSFEDQVSSLLNEELSLLRGRDEVRPPDFDFDNRMIATVYNRLPWNFTSGDGQIAYANNYQMTDVEEAVETYPQGHGDAWGHYLMATKKLYTLLRHPVFDWLVSTESVLVAGQPVQVGYRYERRFAEAAAAKARTGAAVTSQTFRELYDALPSSQQFGYPDSNPHRAWGVIDWGQRAGQAAYLDWVTANSLIDDNAIDATCSNTNEACINDATCAGTCDASVCSNTGAGCATDAECEGLCVPIPPGRICENSGNTCTDPADCDPGESCLFRNNQYVCSNTGEACGDDTDCPGARCVVNTSFVTSIRRIDRTTVPELREIAASYNELQTTLDQADAGLNPLGVASNVVPFGISPRLLDEGQTHFDQVFQRAVTALSNAVTAFDYANESTRRLRRVQDDVDQFDDLIEERELDYTARLIEVFGRPYAEDVGPGATYPTGYNGPDIYHFDYVEDTNLLPLSNASNTVTITSTFEEPQVDPITGAFNNVTRTITYNISTDGLGLLKPEGWEERPEPGEIQFARGELLQAMGRYRQALDRYEAHIEQVEGQAILLESLFGLNANVIQIQRQGQAEQRSLNQEILISRSLIVLFRTIAQAVDSSAEASAECPPGVIGVIGGLAAGTIFDPGFPARCAAKNVGAALTKVFDTLGDAQVLFELQRQHDKEWASAEQQIQLTGVQNAYQEEQQVEALRQLVRQTPSLRLELYLLEESIKQATGRYYAALGRGVRLLEQRTAFRQRTADQITEHRYRDLAFRVFRNEALQKYRAQFDLAARYAFLAAQAYDYESNLLRSDQLGGQQFLTRIVGERSLGVLQNGAPIVGNGLAGLMAEMGLNWDLVIRPQLGFNSPEEFRRTFSLRWELFRIPQSVSGDTLWQDVLQGDLTGLTVPSGVGVEVVPDINSIPEYLYYCKPLQPDPQSPSITGALVIRFPTKVFSGLNFFGRESQGDEIYPSTYDTIKLRGVGVRFTNYPTGVLNNQAEVYLVPVGTDFMRVPTDGSVRGFELLDTTLPQPFPINTPDLARSDWMPFDTMAGGSVAMLKRRLHPQVTGLPAQGSSDDEDLRFHLTGRSVWNSQWALIIPESELRGDTGALGGLQYFTHGPTGASPGTGVRDIRLIFDSYGYVGGPILNAEEENQQTTKQIHNETRTRR